MPDLIEDANFWSHVEPGHADDECWPWLGTLTPKGYGRYGKNGALRAHRLAYEIERGPIPEGCEVHHLCENPACVNPAHLAAVAPKDHRRAHPLAGAALTHASMTECKYGHPFDGHNGYQRTCSICRRRITREWARKQRKGA